MNEIYDNARAGQESDIWKDAQGDDLPEYDREVIVLRRYYGAGWMVCFAHRPNPRGYFTEDKDSRETMRVRPIINDKGGWNYPDVAWWLDVELPKMEDEK